MSDLPLLYRNLIMGYDIQQSIGNYNLLTAVSKLHSMRGKGGGGWVGHSGGITVGEIE